MIEYLVKDFGDSKERKYVLSYQELREKYYHFIELNDGDFLKELPDALHFACVVSWMKELGNETTISDCGIIHELVHVLTNGSGNKYHFKKVRKQFKHILKLD